MSGALSKRQQASNERALQDLVKIVPGNNVCADCQVPNPGWASWNLGIFVCMRCAALHRKMGTHISKVKSLSMDSWSNEQVENMKKVGNIESNQTFNPGNKKPSIPVDVDEADSAMERFIRQKYQGRSKGAIRPQRRQNTGSSDEGPPPTLPPKPTSRFGFRSASSIFPLSSKSRNNTAPASNTQKSPRNNKQSRVFGASVGPDDLDNKMAKLKEMGFVDETRNFAVLKGLGGSMEKSIETLTRLGEGPGSVNTVKTESRSTSSSRSPVAAGLTIDRTQPRSPTRSSTNPFDMFDNPAPIAQPQSSQSTGNKPYQSQANTNPFGINSQSQYSLNQAFQNMNVAPSQRLFPNHTGGFPGPQQPHQELPQQSMTPPIPSNYQNHPSVIYENQAQQTQQSHSYNPFMQQQVQQASAINTNFSNLFGAHMQSSQNPYRSPVQQSPLQPNPQASPNNTFQQAPQQQMNPFFNQNNQQQAPQQSFSYQDPNQMQMHPQYQQYRQQTHPVIPQQTAMRADKSSILDLFNYPQLAPTPFQQPDHTQNLNQSTPPISGAQFPQQPHRSFSSPLATHMEVNRNPFMSNGMGSAMMQSPDSGSISSGGPFRPQNGTRHTSQESIGVEGGGWQNGRHSPDAWGTIARSMR